MIPNINGGTHHEGVTAMIAVLKKDIDARMREYEELLAEGARGHARETLHYAIESHMLMLDFIKVKHDVFGTEDKAFDPQQLKNLRARNVAEYDMAKRTFADHYVASMGAKDVDAAMLANAARKMFRKREKDTKRHVKKMATHDQVADLDNYLHKTLEVRMEQGYSVPDTIDNADIL